MSLANGVNAVKALTDLYGAQGLLAYLRVELKKNDLTVQTANQRLENLARVRENLAAAPPEDFPNMGAFAAGFWGVESFDYASQHVAASKEAEEMQTALDNYLTNSGLKLRVLSAIERTALATAVDSVEKSAVSADAAMKVG